MPVGLDGDATITADDDLFFDGTVTGTSANLSATVDDLTRFGGAVELASITDLLTETFTGRTELGANLTLNGPGDTAFYKPFLVTGDAVIDLTGTAAALDFSTVDASGAFDLTIHTGTGGNASPLNFNGSIGDDALGGSSRNAGLDSLTIDGDGAVTIAELVRLVGIALGRLAVSGCSAGDVDESSTSSVDELVAIIDKLSQLPNVQDVRRLA